MTPPPGSPAPELLVAKFHGHARRLVWSALVLVVVAGVAGYFVGNLPAPVSNWPYADLALLVVAAAVVLLLVVVPFLVWSSRLYTITTRRVIVRTGVFARRRRELAHERGYRISVRRGPLQRMWRCGTLTLDDGVDRPLELVNVPNVALVHEVLVDQVEVSQILAHRDGLVIPPQPPLPR